MDFKIGDKVVVVKDNTRDNSMLNMVGTVCTISNAKSSTEIGVDFKKEMFSFTHDLHGRITTNTGRYYGKSSLNLYNEYVVDLI